MSTTRRALFALYRVAYALDEPHLGYALAEMLLPGLRIRDGVMWMPGYPAWRFA
ncbi:MAG: hypothetical protein H0U59_10670 [Gemmatimonadaceae bacterium]|nr:hypothetical protein [Gemmatimonadaceae bacterium]